MSNHFVFLGIPLVAVGLTLWLAVDYYGNEHM